MGRRAGVIRLAVKAGRAAVASRRAHILVANDIVVVEWGDNYCCLSETEIDVVQQGKRECQPDPRTGELREDTWLWRYIFVFIQGCPLRWP